MVIYSLIDRIGSVAIISSLGMEALQQHLQVSGVDESDVKDEIVPNLWKKGFRKIADLEFLEREDLDGKYCDI